MDCLAKAIDEIEELRDAMNKLPAPDWALREMTRLRAAMLWQPIETAPRDGTPILAHDGEGVEIVDGEVLYDSAWWEICSHPDNEVCRPTHWMPLPDPPEVTP